MGCLGVSISSVTLSVGGSVERIGGASISAKCENGITLGAKNRHKKAALNIALVCRVGILPQYVYLAVSEGWVLTINNEYLTVKNRSYGV